MSVGVCIIFVLIMAMAETYFIVFIKIQIIIYPNYYFNVYYGCMFGASPKLKGGGVLFHFLLKHCKNLIVYFPKKKKACVYYVTINVIFCV